MIYTQKILNNGYGEPGRTSTRKVKREVVDEVWSYQFGQEDFDRDKEVHLDDVMEESGFGWNLTVYDNREEIIRELNEKGFVVREIEDSILGLCEDDKKQEMLSEIRKLL